MEIDLKKIDTFHGHEILKRILVIREVKRDDWGIPIYYLVIRCPLCGHESKTFIAVNGVLDDADFAGGLKRHLFTRHNFGNFFETWKDWPSTVLSWRCKICGEKGWRVISMLDHYLTHLEKEKVVK